MPRVSLSVSCACSLKIYCFNYKHSMRVALLAAYFLLLIWQPVNSDVKPSRSVVDLKGNEGSPDGAQDIHQTTVLLFGGLGDLATRYLWRGFFNLYRTKYSEAGSQRKLRIFTTGRTDEHEGVAKMDETFTDYYFCGEKEKSCLQYAHAFRKSCSYHKTKSERDYKALRGKILSEKESDTQEGLRIIYLSVPPFAYPLILDMIHKYLRPKNSKSLLRIVFEKPFGHDASSSAQLQALITKYFVEEQVFRVDHYLGKQTVAEVMNFRMKNQKKLSKVWNDKFIESVEIVMKESIDCKGRTEFFSKYGVVLDVMQNHLTEMLLRLVMRIPTQQNHKYFVESKLEALKQIPSPKMKDVVIGQYSSYQEHLMQDFAAKNKTPEAYEFSTPTFASVKISHNSSSFARTRFILMSGKKLDTKSSFIKINFRPFYKFNAGNLDSFEGEFPENGYIKFCIHCKSANGPAIEVSPSLENLNLEFPDGWRQNSNYGSKVFVPSSTMDAYSFLIQQIDKGNKDLFVDSDSLSESWRIWDAVQNFVKSGNIPLVHYDAKSLEKLGFYFNYFTDSLRLSTDPVSSPFKNSESFQADKSFQFSSLEEMKFLGSRLITGVSDLVISKLAADIILSASDAHKQGKLYHIAFPGGSSIVPLYRKLCEQKSSWLKDTLHVWLVDERCVPLNHTKSNFKLLMDNLQLCLQLPYQNLHPILTGRRENACRQNTAFDYAEEIQGWLPSMQFDMIVLGLGQDGHIASIFPGDRETIQSSEFVDTNESGPEKDISARATLTLRLINIAERLSIIAIGQGKREIVQRLKSQTGLHLSGLPITMLKSSKYYVSWYIDEIAYD